MVLTPHLRRTRAGPARGAPASIILPSVRGRNTSLITAISREEVLFLKPISGLVDTTKYRDFFMGLIAKCVEKNIITRCTFIMDNARIHNAMMMREFYTKNELTIKFLSPYSYMLNPIEFGFSKIKACVRRRLAEGYNGGFVDLIQESTRELSESDLRGYYNHIVRNCVKAVALEDFN